MTRGLALYRTTKRCNSIVLDDCLVNQAITTAIKQTYCWVDIWRISFNGNIGGMGKILQLFIKFINPENFMRFYWERILHTIILLTQVYNLTIKKTIVKK